MNFTGCNLLSNVEFPLSYTDSYALTDLGRSFAENFSERTGIDTVLCSCFIVRKVLSLSIHARGLDFGDSGLILNVNLSLSKDSGRLCPIVSDALSALAECDATGGISNALSGVSAVDLSLYDYGACMRDAFFASHLFADIEAEARALYPDCKFLIRLCGSGRYYLIFETDKALEQYDRIGTAGQIARSIEKLTAAKDYLSAFRNEPPKPVITCYEELKRTGGIMGIMRNNPAFDSLVFE
ncbi:MAG: hypothetical protein ILO42_07250 [Clostridia bacterium]|nr:hypothetical protein [Clostridia bacterium]